MKNISLDYYYANEAELFNFYRIPKVLFTDERFSNLSVEAKVLYGLLLDRMCLSLKNGWVDEKNKVYIYFTLEDAIEYLNVGKDKGVKLFSELDSEKGCGLIERKKQGLGKPTIIYVMNFTTGDKDYDKEERSKKSSKIQTSEKPKSGAVDNAEVLTSEKAKSRVPENRSHEVGKTEANNTDINNTDFNETFLIKSYQSQEGGKDMIDRETYRKIIEHNIEFECLIKNYIKEDIEGLVNIILDAVCSAKPYLCIACDEIPQEEVKHRLMKLNYSHIEYVMDSLKINVSKVKNIKSYLLTMLYNSISTIGHYYRAEVNHDTYGGIL
ncbi:MAG: replication initiator protein A [Ruminococcaceae bacterium]|nr:replication initiator protein A [Oscillospiraceae bacterium]